MLSSEFWYVGHIPVLTENKPTLMLYSPDKRPKLADKQTGEENSFIMWGSNTDLHTGIHTQPYQSLQKGGIFDAQPGAEAAGGHQERGTGEGEDGRQGDVGVREK